MKRTSLHKATCETCHVGFLTRATWDSPKRFCSEPCRRVGQKHWMLDTEARENIRQGAIEYHATLRGGPKPPPQKGDASASAKKRWADPIKRKTLVAQLQAGRTKAVQNGVFLRMRMQQRFPTKGTVIEEILRQEFEHRNLQFEMHKAVFGRFQPDFTFDSVHLFVQADGIYWHSLTRNKHYDALFDAMADAEGWTVWRFSEPQIKNNPTACGDAVAAFITSYSP